MPKLLKKELNVIVIIPTYNCSKQIVRVLEGFDDRLLHRLKEVVVVDNRSSDDTVSEARRIVKKLGSSKIHVAKNVQNVSLGGTHKVGFIYGNECGADYIAILHGDDQATTSELHSLLDVIEGSPGIDAVLGSRFMKGSHLSGYSSRRIWGNRVLNVLYSIIMLRTVRDLGSGLNIFKLTSIDKKQYLNFGDDLGFNFDLLLYLLKFKKKIHFTPISWKEEDQVSNARNFKVAKLAVIRLLKWRFGIKPANFTKRKESDYKFTWEDRIAT